MDEIKQEEVEIEELIEAKPEEAKISPRNKAILLALFGILLGFVIKTEAAKRVTVGFEDYKLLSAEESYNINNLEKELKLQEAVQTEQAGETENKALESAQQGESADSEKTTCDVGAGETCE